MQRTAAFMVLAGALLAPAVVRADELFDARSTVPHYSLSTLLGHFRHAGPTVREEELSALAPAAGDEAKPAEHGAAAESKGEHAPKKSHTGKDLTGKPTIPSVTIGGQVVVTRQAQRDKDVSASTPAELKGPANAEMLEQRAKIKTYAHSPAKGPVNGDIKVVLFEDLSCSQCMPYLAKIDEALKTYVSETRVVFVNAPTLKFQDTNQPAFYGKIAARMGVFWPYRAKLIASPPANDGELFDDLVASGVTLRDARSLMLNDARRFYRELDGDALLAQAFRVSRPPVAYVNGIRVGDGGVPLEKLREVLDYVHHRIELNLGEPPQ